MNLEVAIQGYFFFLFIFIFTNLRGLWEGMILVNGSLRDERNALMQIFFCFEEKKKPPSPPFSILRIHLS